jgi:hypothetical protein
MIIILEALRCSSSVAIFNDSITGFELYKNANGAAKVVVIVIFSHIPSLLMS